MGKKILVVDDDPDLIEAVSTLLDAKGYTMLSAPNGEEGFKKAVSEMPNLILLDVMMIKKTEGFDLAVRLKNEPKTKDIPVVMMTGIRKEMSLPFGFEPDSDWLPVKVFLEKPVKPETLLKTVEENIK